MCAWATASVALPEPPFYATTETFPICQCQYNVPSFSPSKIPTLEDGIGGQPLSNVGIFGQVERDLRHSFPSRALALGESITMIGKLLGHTQSADDRPLCPPRTGFHPDGGRTDNWEHWGGLLAEPTERVDRPGSGEHKEKSG